jgi:hypothetical protein
MHPDRLEQED